MATPDFMTTGKVSDLLGVSTRQVARLVETGRLVGVARGLVDQTSVERYRAEGHEGHRTRAWAGHTAWAAVALLSGERADWLGQPQTSRLRAALRQMSVDGLVDRCRDRAIVRTYFGHSSVRDRLHGALVVADATKLGLTAGTGVDGYLSTGEATDVVRRYALWESPTGGLTLRRTGFDLTTIAQLADAGLVLPALDCATSLDPRVRGVARAALGDALARFGNGR